MRREEAEVGEVQVEDTREEGSVKADCRPSTARTMDLVPLSNRQLQEANRMATHTAGVTPDAGTPMDIDR